MKIHKLILTVMAATMLFSSCEKKVKEVYGIALSQTETYNFEPETTSQYPPKTPLTVTVTNTGNVETGELLLSADGASASSFALSASSIASIAAGETATFTVAPVLALAKGDYQATVHVSNRNVTEQNFDVRFVITDMVVTAIKIVSQPTQTVYGVGEPFNVDGLSVVAVGEKGEEEPLEITPDSEYLVYDFSAPSAKDEEGTIIPTKVQIVVGAAPVQEIPVSVLSLADRVNAANGTEATIIVYADEKEMDSNIIVNAAGSNITIKTAEGISKDVIIKRSTKGSVIYVKGNGTEGEVKVTLDGYVTLKGRATQEYGGTDEDNNNNKILLISTAGLVEMKGHSKLTCNAQSSETTGGGVFIKDYGHLIMTDDSQVSKCTCFSTGTSTAVLWGGAFYLSNYGKLTVKGNAKITGNRVLSAGGNAYGGALFMDTYSELRIEGGEFSDNIAESVKGIAGGAALMLTNSSSKTYLSGGVIKNNVLKYKTACRGGAITAAGSQKLLHISGAPVIEPKADGAITKENDSYTNTLNTLALQSGTSINISGDLTYTVIPKLDLVVNSASYDASLPILRKYTVVDGENIYESYTTEAPVSKFLLNNLVDYGAGTIAPIDTKKIDVDGKLIDK